jgi:GT2 family glycosyltransferase
MHPDVLVIIPSYSHFDFVLRTVQSLRESREVKRRIDYVIVDDASEEWDRIDWSGWPDPDCRKIHFDEHAGLTRSWNAGLTMALEIGATYAVCTNSDVLFPTYWLEPMIIALEEGLSLVGPITNAPGHALWQNAQPFCREIANGILDDSKESLCQITKALQAQHIGPIEAPLNGFCLMAKTQTWWKGSFSATEVFNPAFPLVHNEVELERRWHAQGLRMAFVPQSYVFHYRSVSRPAGLNSHVARGAYRPLHPI